MVAEKVRFEFACVLPGITSETPQKEGIFIAEPRLALTMGLFTGNIKGRVSMSILEPESHSLFRNSKTLANSHGSG